MNEEKRKYHREWKRNNPEYMKRQRELQAIRDKELRVLIEEIKDAPCTSCGESYHPAVMDFHHLDETHKDFSLGNYRGKGKKTVLAEIEKCVLLCANCHRLVHAGVKKLGD